MSDFPEMRNMARSLLTHEAVGVEPSEAVFQVAVRVCEKFRSPLSTLAGVAGYKALISRALALAMSDVPSIGAVHIREDGSLELPAQEAPPRDPDEDLDGGITLVARLLGLLVTFIGDTLTMQLVRDAWPDVPLERIGPETEMP